MHSDFTDCTHKHKPEKWKIDKALRFYFILRAEMHPNRPDGNAEKWSEFCCIDWRRLTIYLEFMYDNDMH